METKINCKQCGKEITAKKFNGKVRELCIKCTNKKDRERMKKYRLNKILFHN